MALATTTPDYFPHDANGLPSMDKSANATRLRPGEPLMSPRIALSLGHLPRKREITIDSNWPKTPSKVNPENPPWPVFKGYHEFSFAHATMGHRLPTILGKAIDDVALWNKEIAKYAQGKTFMSAAWVFAEAYKYRRLRECFSISKFWKEYDVFFRQKCDTFSRSQEAVFELSMRFAEGNQLPVGTDEQTALEKERLMFLELTQICLWGNSTDLSLLIDMTEEQIKSLQSTGGDRLNATLKNILGNDLPQLWDTVKALKATEGGRIDFVLDNAGFELYCDFIYADFLIQSGLAKEVRFHGKRYPWFVSDVTRKDWNWLLNTMTYGQLFDKASEQEQSSLRKLGMRWKEYEKEGKWIYEQHPFWCSGWTFWEMPSEAPDLFLHLSHSDLVFFKGDLNHRKLTYDCAAPAATPFEEAIGTMASKAGAPRICSLRTIKSDVVVGLGKEGGEEAAKLDNDEPGWKISGKYAVVLLSRGRPGEKVDLSKP